MSLRRRNWVIAYDIADKKRLTLIYKLCQSFAFPLQNSLFITQATQKELDQFCLSLRSIINENEDDVRIYPTGNFFDMEVMGTSRLPEGVFGMLDILK